jgi:hypothetical protein
MTNSQHTSTKQTRRRPLPAVAFALALVALVAALSNGAYAVASAQKNSVLSKSIKNGHVRTADLAPQAVTTTNLAPNAVTSPHLADGSVTSADIKDGGVTSADIADGTVRGADLSEGAVGAGSLAYIQTVAVNSVATGDADGVNNGGLHGIVGLEAVCPAGSTVIGGGASWVDPSSPNGHLLNVYIQASHPSGNGWYARGVVDLGAQGTIRLRTFASCLMPNGFVAN